MSRNTIVHSCSDMEGKVASSSSSSAQNLLCVEAAVDGGLDSVGNSASHSATATGPVNSNNNSNQQHHNLSSSSSSSSAHLSSGRVVVCKEVFDEKIQEPTLEGTVFYTDFSCKVIHVN